MQTTPYAPPVDTVAFLDFPRYEKTIANLPHPPIIANQIDTSTKEGAERLNNLLYTRYQGDILTSTPKCACGNVSGGIRKGIVCKDCGTECADVLDKPLESTVWIETPQGINKFIGPGFWIVVSKHLTRSNFNLLEWLVDPRYPDPLPNNVLYHVVDYLGLNKAERNLNTFHDRFSEIMRRIVTYSIIKKKPKNIPGLSQEQIVDLYSQMFKDHLCGAEILINTPLGRKYAAEKKFAKFVLKYTAQKDRVFTKYLPLPSAMGLILETNNSGTWGETSLLSAIDAMYSVTQLPASAPDQQIPMKNRRAVVCTKKMAEFSKDYIKESAGAKEGEFRRHLCGGRVPFSMRCVISSINEPHSRDELHLPWEPAVQFFKQDITNKLHRRGFTPRQTTKLIEDYTKQYHPLIDEIFKELIDESDGGIWVTFQRSPSLEKPSIQVMRITRVKTNIFDRTIGMSINATNGPNADFDGDAMHIMRILDRDMLARLENLRPYRSVLSLSNPHEVSGVFKQQPPQTLTMQNYLYGGSTKYNRI